MKTRGDSGLVFGTMMEISGGGGGGEHFADSELLSARRRFTRGSCVRDPKSRVIIVFFFCARALSLFKTEGGRK